MIATEMLLSKAIGYAHPVRLGISVGTSTAIIADSALMPNCLSNSRYPLLLVADLGSTNADIQPRSIPKNFITASKV
jgi:hypothetical protein